jgi:MoaA/NifB/PqqE/SkfB family radical SAM enzyme
MKTEVITPTLIKMIKQKHLRRIFSRRIDEYLYSKMVVEADEDLEKVKLRRYQFLSAMLSCVVRNMDKGYVSGDIITRIVKVLVENNFICQDSVYEQAVKRFKEEFNEEPPTFIVLSPTQVCNLHCIGCYANSAANKPATIPYKYADKILDEIYNRWGCRFVTISGGEPFMYKSGEYGLTDIFEKYNDMFFLVYTNGTLLTREVSKKLAELSNVTPAISVEGFERHTDDRRGAGAFKKILNAFGNLREFGVPFGVSVTATKRNVDVLLSDEFYEFYFEKQGACYMWEFQLMPIGRGKDEIDLMVTPEQRLQLFRKWEELLSEKKYCLADFWNSGVLSRGCIAYGRSGGYAYIDWHGNVTPCAFIPYYVDNIYDLYDNGRSLTDALFSDFMKAGRKWQKDYGLDNWKKPKNWLMPCSIRDHYEIFRRTVLPKKVGYEDEKAQEAVESAEYFEIMKNYDNRLKELTENIWENEYLDV